MSKIISLDEKYSTTKLLVKEKPVIINNPEDKFETLLFLPEGKNRKGEGGLRKKDFFKKSFEEKPLISIMTVVYNGETFLEDTILSVIQQTYDNVEYIIIDGASTDRTLDIIKKYEDKIDYWVSEQDSGIYDAMNKGIALATGEYINFMNAGDNFFNNEIIKKLFRKIDLNVTLIYGKVALYYKESLISLYGNNKIVPHQGAFFKTKPMKEYKFDTNLKIFADGELLSRLQKLDNYNAEFIDLVIANFYLGGVGNHPKYFLKRLKEEIKIKNNKKQDISLKWFILKLYNFIGFIFYKIFGEWVYYKIFEKILLKIIQGIK